MSPKLLFRVEESDFPYVAGFYDGEEEKFQFGFETMEDLEDFKRYIPERITWAQVQNLFDSFEDWRKAEKIHERVLRGILQ